MVKKTLLILTALFVSACSREVIFSSSEGQKIQIKQVDKASQKGKVRLYVCQGNKQVRVVHSVRKTKKKTLQTITLTFNGVTEKLLLSVSERGKNYSNIRWHWQEREDFSRLTTATGKVLAEKCVVEKGEHSGTTTNIAHRAGLPAMEK